MDAMERIVMLSKARRMLDGRGSVSIGELRTILDAVLDDMVNESYEKIAR